jgi:periplasmic protein TonB
MLTDSAKMSFQALSESMSDSFPGSSPNARFLAGSLPVGDTSWKSYLLRSSWSVVIHLLGLGILLWAITRTGAMDTLAKAIKAPDITWIASPGPGGGGGGGGNKMPDPPKKAELSGKEKITVPVAKPAPVQPTPPKEQPKPAEQLTIPAQTMASGVTELPGAISNLPTMPTASQGSGSGGGAGTGTGTGIGPGRGSGLGDGEGGGTGGGVYRPGNGVISPRLLQEVKPGYTGEAMRAKIQGVVVMEAVVLPDGSIGNVHITRSLDPTFGLDQEAIKAARQWRFKPSMRLGEPVPVLVRLELEFTIR